MSAHYATPDYVNQIMLQHQAKYWIIKDAQGGKAYINKQDQDIDLYQSIEMMQDCLDQIQGTVSVTVMQKFDTSPSSNYDRFTFLVRKPTRTRTAVAVGSPYPQQAVPGNTVSLDRYLEILERKNELQNQVFQLQNANTLTGLDRLLDKVVEDPTIVHQMISGFRAPAPIQVSKVDTQNAATELDKTIARLKKIDPDLPITLMQLAAVAEASPETLTFFKEQLKNYTNG
jgi:hypothetical protein